MPALTACAVVMMRLVAACRWISTRRVTTTAPDRMMSPSTWPGPTEGNWSASPTSSTAIPGGTAFSTCAIISTSTIDVSSMTSRSPSSGCRSVRRNCPFFGLISSRRCSVLASSPVASVMRLAARPVGAPSSGRTPLAARIVRMARSTVVLPTPGPPVNTTTLCARAVSTACRWLGDNSMASRASTHGIARAASRPSHGGRPDASARSRAATTSSAACSPARRTSGVPSTSARTSVRSASSSARPSSTRSSATESVVAAVWRSWSSGSPQCPSSSACARQWASPARTRIIASCSMPSWRAMRSAVRKPIPRMSRDRR